MTDGAPVIVPIVEGAGDKAAAPVLLRRVLGERLNRYDIVVKHPKKANGRHKLVKKLEKFLGFARIEPGCAAILVLLDADKCCPRELGVKLARRARDAGVGIPIAVVCANREYENWFLASDADFTGDAEEFRGAKGWLTHKIGLHGLKYKETQDQEKFSATMDIEAAFTASRSFHRLCNAVEELVCCIDAHTTTVTPE